MSARLFACAALLALLLSACGGSLTDAEADAAGDTATTQPVDCRHHPEHCA